MPYRTFNLKEFAKHVCMDARDVERLADEGRIPGHKVGGKWRFHRGRVTEWLQQHIHTLDGDHLHALDESFGQKVNATSSIESRTLTDLIPCDGIDVQLPARTRVSVLRELVKLCEHTGLLYDARGLQDSLVEREALGSTALPNGVAIPHARQPLPYATAMPLVCVGRVGAGIAFGSINHCLTHLFFLICCHDDEQHLHVLARLMRILDQDTVDLLMAAESPDALRATLANRERHVMAYVGSA